jgi:hypothetical protein
MAEMVRKKPATLQELMALEGIGEARGRQFGELFLGMLATAVPAANP